MSAHDTAKRIMRFLDIDNEGDFAFVKAVVQDEITRAVKSARSADERQRASLDKKRTKKRKYNRVRQRNRRV